MRGPAAQFLPIWLNRKVSSKNEQPFYNNGAGGGGRTHMPSEGRGILSPVRLPVPPLQQVYDSFELTMLSPLAHWYGSGNASEGNRLTLRSRAARSCLLFWAYSSKRLPASASAKSSSLMTL